LKDHSKSFYLIAIILGLAVGLIAAELAATAYYVFHDGKYMTPRKRLEAERNAYTETARTTTASKSCGYGDSLIIHPYLAFVQTALGPCGVSYANAKSLIGKDFVDKPRPRIGIVLVTGGSVAAQFVWDNRQKESALERILNAEFTGDRFDRFVVLNGGHGGWKQPNQYILFGLYADVLTGVISLDGFNEHYMANASQRFELPAANFFQVIERQDPRVTTAPLSIAALKLEADLYRFATRHTLFHVSNLAYLAVDLMRGKLRRYAAKAPKRAADDEEDWVKATYEKMFAFNEPMTPAERKTWAFAQYEKYIRLMHAGAQAMGIKSLFLIQPIPGLGKPPTDQENIFAQKTNKKLYKEMADDLAGLRGRYGIPVYSLIDVFQARSEEIYKDQVHVNDLGNEIMARQIADLIEKVWQWPRKQKNPAAAALGRHPPR
jgi:hypothetical protein